MTTEETTQPNPPAHRIKSQWRCWASGLVLLLILAGLLGLGYCGWKLKMQVAEQSLVINQTITDLTQQEKQQANQLAAQQKTLDTWKSKQEQVTQQIQKLAVSNLSGSSMGGVLHNLTNQIAIIQLLISNQQYSLAINLLAALEAELSVLPDEQRQTVMTALEADRERIQQVQTAEQQILGQLQQLQQHINQQLLLHFGPAASEAKSAVEENVSGSRDTNQEGFLAQLQQQLKQAVQVQHSSTAENPVLPAFYSGVMLQLALYQAQFALTQGNWMEFQLALTSIQSWLTPDTLSWLPDMASVMQTLASLAQQPPAYSSANVNATQQAIIKITRNYSSS